MKIEIRAPKQRGAKPFSLSIEQCRAVVRHTVKALKLRHAPAMRITSRPRGRAHTEDGYFTIPINALTRHAAYATYYIVHELCHFGPCYGRLNKQNKWVPVFALRQHGAAFRRLENQICEDLGVRLVYPARGPYPKQVRSLAPEPEYSI